MLDQYTNNDHQSVLIPLDLIAEYCSKLQLLNQMSYFYIFMTIILTVYGQIIIKWQALNAGHLPINFTDKLWFLIELLMNPWIISAFLAAFLASLTWIAAMTKLDLSHAYPFMSTAFILVLILSGIFFNEPITIMKILGLIFIVVGIIISSQG